MKQIKSLFVNICVFVVLLAAVQSGFPQSAEPNYEVMLQMIVGSNDAATKADMPVALKPLSQQFASRFGFSNYRLAGTMLGRLGAAGEFDYRSVSPLFAKNSEYRSPSFLEWNFKGLRSSPGAKGNHFAFQSFRFGARVPVPVVSTKDQAGKEQSVTNYEQIGVTSKTFAIPENSPTLVATLNLPGGADMIFLIMTVRPVDL